MESPPEWIFPLLNRFYSFRTGLYQLTKRKRGDAKQNNVGGGTKRNRSGTKRNRSGAMGCLLNSLLQK